MRAKFSSKLIVIFLFLTILISGWLYRDSFNSYFFQDDWFTLRISNAKTFSDVFRFFVPRTDVIYYRPLGMQIPFFVLRSMFGVNPLPFRILTFITHAANVILVYFLVRLLTKREIVALLSAFFYSSSAVHYIPFFWSATYAFILGPTAFFLSFILFLLYIQKEKRFYLIFSLLVFFLGLLINEIIVTLPVIIFIYLIIVKKLKSSSYLLSFIFLSLLLFLPRFFLFPPPSKGVYQLGIGRHILTNLKTYIFWSFNWSEILTEQMVRPFAFNRVIADQYSSYITVALATFFILSSIFYLLSLILLRFKLEKKALRVIVFGAVWFIVGLSPVFLFPHHKYPYYLPISLVGFLIISSFLIDCSFKVIYGLNKIVVLLFLFILFFNWVLATKNTIDLNSKIHWAPRRAKISARLVKSARDYYHKNPLKDTSFYVGLTSENKWALNDQDAFKLICGDESIITKYTDRVGEDVLKTP